MTRTRSVSQILVRNLDEAVVEQLRARARAHGRSLEAEVRDILTASTAEERRLAARHAYLDAARELRASFGEQVFTDSVDLLREDRESH